jgi:hypothetical protein
VEDVRSKDTREQVADDATNAVLSEDIHGLINANEELDLGGKVADDTANDTEDDGSPGGDVAGGRGDGDEAGNGTRAEADGAPLLVEAVIEQAPGEATDASSNVGNKASHDSAEVGSEGRATVEAEPADPEEDGAKDDVGDVVRAVGKAINLAVAGALAEHQRVGEGSGAGGNVDGSTTGEVETAHLERPALRVPGPVGNGVVDDGGPDEHENDAGQHAATVSSSANSERGPKGNALATLFVSNNQIPKLRNIRESREHALVEAEEEVRQGTSNREVAENALETKVGEIPNEAGMASVREGE